MRIPRFIIPLEINLHDAVGAEVSISGAEFHHLKNVLRKSPGDEVEILDKASGRAFRALLSTVEAQQATAKITCPAPQKQLSKIALVAGATKPKTMDFVVEKAVELGVAEIHFFSAERSQQHLKEDLKQRRLERLRRVAEAALKQSGSAGGLPKIDFHQNLDSALSNLHSEPCSAPVLGRYVLAQPQAQNPTTDLLGLLLEDFQAENEAAQLLDNTLDSSTHKTPPSELSRSDQKPRFGLENIQKYAESYILIGPEGGMTRIELETALNYGYAPASLGQKTLRAETAAVVACALVELVHQFKRS